jgi:hypothetical protein
LSGIEAQEAKKSESSKGSWVSDRIIIAAVPLIGYILSFVYEAGYAGVFKIPLYFITIDLTTVLVATGSLLLFAIFFLVLLDLLFIFSFR